MFVVSIKLHFTEITDTKLLSILVSIFIFGVLNTFPPKTFHKNKYTDGKIIGALVLAIYLSVLDKGALIEAGIYKVTTGVVFFKLYYMNKCRR